MCNVPKDVMNKLEKTVTQFLEEGRMFTGYDVTIETRTREQMTLHHRDVREAVHEMDVLKDAMDFGYDQANGRTLKWSKTQHTMPGGGWAWVFHPTNMDPNGYVPRGNGQAQSHTAHKVATPATPVAAVATGPSISIADPVSDSGGQQDDGSFETDYRGRLLVPTHYFKDAGISAGDRVCVIVDSSALLIVKETALNGAASTSVTTQIVERNGDIRLSSKTLTAANFRGSSFVIEAKDSTVSGQSVKAVEVKETHVAGN